MKEILKRSQVNPDYTWNLSHMISSEAAFDEKIRLVESLSDKMTSFKGRLHESAELVAQCLHAKDQVNEVLGVLNCYSNMAMHQDTSNTQEQNRVGKINSLKTKVSENLAYIEPELTNLPEEVLTSYIGSAELSLYNYYFKNMLRQKAHILSQNEELLLAMANELYEAPHKIFSMFNDADIKFPTIKDESGNDVELTKGRFILFLESENPTVREEAFKTLYATYKKSKNQVAAILESHMKADHFMSKARKYQSTCQAALDPNNIDVSVYTNLIDTVHDHLPLMHRYVSLRKKMLSLDTIHFYDLYTPMVGDVSFNVPYEEAKTILLDGLAPMGDEYLSLLKEGFEGGWIDVYENEGKRGGAYSWGSFGYHPYVLLNYQDNLNNLFTFAHEMGHSLHTYYSNETQPYVYHNYPIFLAEVASTVNETLLIEYLLKVETDKNKRLYLLNHYMEKFRGTLYRQTMFAEFEKQVHERVESGEALTSEGLCEMYLALNKTYFGEEMTYDEEISYEWMRIPHFYYNYYVYQYATGFSSAISIASDILDKGKVAVDNYMHFLRGGSSDDPLNILANAGVDMRTKEPIAKALKVFEKILDEFESLLAE